MYPRTQKLFYRLVCISAGLVFVFVIYSRFSGSTTLARHTTDDGHPPYLKCTKDIASQKDTTRTYDGQSITEGYVYDSDNTRGNYTFLLNSRHHCFVKPKKDKSVIRVAIIVISKTDSFIQRYVIRKTWGLCKQCKAKVKMVFLIGTTSNAAEQDQIFKEYQMYRDVVQVNFTDKYETLMYKSVAMLEWFYRYCRYADIFIKVDDDTYLDIPRIANITSEFNIERYFFCSVFQGAKPIRRKESKWYVSHEYYSGGVYPTYCSGPAYIFSSSILTDLYKTTLMSKYMPMEDVFITGISAKKLNVTYVHSPKFIYQWKNRVIDCKIKQRYATHHVDVTDVLNIYSYLKRNKCE